MRKNAFFLIGLFVLIIVGCSNEDTDGVFIRPEVPGVNLAEDEIQIVFKPSEDNSIIEFEIELLGEAPDEVKINWGTDNKLYTYPVGSLISYDFSFGKDDEYLITIQAPGIIGLDLTYEGGDQLKSVFFGACESLENISIITVNNILENFDVSQCPIIKRGNGGVFYIYTSNFNLDGLKNMEQLSLLFCVERDVILSEMNFNYLELGFDVRYNSGIIIKDCPLLEQLKIVGYGNHNWQSYYTTFSKFELEGNIRRLDLAQIDVRSILDVSKLQNLEILSLFSFTCQETIKLSPALHAFYGVDHLFGDNNQLKYLDFSSCKNITSIFISGFRNFESYNVDGCDKLSSFCIFGSNYLDDVEITNTMDEEIKAEKHSNRKSEKNLFLGK